KKVDDIRGEIRLFTQDSLKRDEPSFRALIMRNGLWVHVIEQVIARILLTEIVVSPNNPAPQRGVRPREEEGVMVTPVDDLGKDQARAWEDQTREGTVVGIPRPWDFGIRGTRPE